MTIIDDDAREYGEHVRHGGWRLALLVARSVERDAGHGGKPIDRAVSKTSATKFAVMSGTTHSRVLRHLDAWEKAADAGHVAHAADIEPGQEVALPAAELWTTMYDATASGGRPRDSKPVDAALIIAKRGAVAVIAEMTDEQQREMFTALQLLFEQRADAERGERPRHTPDRLDQGIMLLAVMKARLRIKEAVDALRAGDVGVLDSDDQLRLHVLITSIRDALDLLDAAAGGGIDDAAIEQWLSQDVS
jgi:hypothetical protein